MCKDRKELRQREVQRHKCARNREMQIQIVGETEGCRKREKQKVERSGQRCEETEKCKDRDMQRQ
jgi:hypothetical protein